MTSVFLGLAVGYYTSTFGVYVPNYLKLQEGNLKEHLPSPEKKKKWHPKRKTKMVSVYKELIISLGLD